MQALALTISWWKCNLRIAEALPHLGFALNVAEHCFELSEKQFRKLHEKVTMLLGLAAANSCWVPKRRLASVVGYI